MPESNDELISELVGGGYLKSPPLIKAFKEIDRKNFVPEEYLGEAYGNYPLPIGHGQTISQPLTVAFMLELLEPEPGDKILEIGTGSGWVAALLADVVGVKGGVVSVDRIKELVGFARKNLSQYGFMEKGILKLIVGDGSKGHGSEAPYDKIIAAAAGGEIPEAWKRQLKSGGRIVAPVGQSIVVLDKISENKFKEKEFSGFSFVPLIKDDQI